MCSRASDSSLSEYLTVVGVRECFANWLVVVSRLQHLLRRPENADAIAQSIVLEQGKTLAGMS